MDSTRLPFQPDFGAHPASPRTAELPRDLCMDLLVDGELPEEDRRRFLLELDRGSLCKSDPQWRDLAIRFLQRQTEKQTAQALMAGGNLLPGDRRPSVHRWNRITGWRSMTAIAASLLIVAGAGLVLLEMGPSRGHPANSAPANFNATLPPEVLGDRTSGNVVVPVVTDAGNSPLQFLPAASNDGTIRRASVIIYPEDNDTAVTVPVNTLKAKYN